VGAFYPAAAGSGDLLHLYSGRFDAVELGATFHRVPSADTARAWAADTPVGFRFCVKAPRALTRRLQASGAGESAAALRAFVAALGGRAGPVLVQIPGSMPAEPARLDRFLAALAGLPVAVEARHPAWRSDACLRVLSRRGAALVADAGAAGSLPPEITTDFAYLRMSASRNPDDVAVRAEQAALLARRGVEVWAFVRPAPGTAAALEALEFRLGLDRRLAGRQALRPPGRGEQPSFGGPGEQILPRA